MNESTHEYGIPTSQSPSASPISEAVSLWGNILDQNHSMTLKKGVTTEVVRKGQAGAQGLTAIVPGIL